MEILFKVKKLKGVVDGTEACPRLSTGTTQKDIDDWVEKDEQAQMLLYEALSMRALETLTQQKTSAAMWKKLCAVHQHKTKENILILQTEFFDYKMKKGDNMNAHIDKLNEMAQVLRDVGEPISERVVMNKIVSSLPPSYNNVGSAWANVETDKQNMDNLSARLLRHELVLKMQGMDITTKDTAFFTRNSRYQGSSSSSNKFSKAQQREKDEEYVRELKQRTKCFKCGKKGHWSNECSEPIRQKIGFQRSSVNIVAARDSSSEDDDDDYYAIMVHSHAMIAKGESDLWYTDTGASEHMSDRKDWFINLTEIPKGKHKVMVADDRCLSVKGHGDIFIDRTVAGVVKKGILKQVLYIPELKRNLFSIGQATEMGLSFMSTKEKCELRTGSEPGKVVMEGQRDGKPYSLRIKAITGSEANIVHTEQKDIPKIPLPIWHSRMVHVNIETIQQMKLNDSLKHFDLTTPKDSSSKLCPGCMYGKQHKNSYPSNPEKECSAILGEFVHADVCGPMKERSIGGARYYLLFKDDSTGYRYVYFLKQKSEVFTYFKQMVKELERDIGNKLKKFRSDRGGEFYSKAFDTYLLDNLIKRETSAAATP
jgi:hypothetical protein